MTVAARCPCGAIGPCANPRCHIRTGYAPGGERLHVTRIAWCGTPTGDGLRGRCSCGWMGDPTPVKAVALVDCGKHEESHS